MVAFFLPTGVATELAAQVEKALPKGATPLPANEMHVTLAYLGQTGQDGLDARVAKRLVRNLKTFARSVPALTATVGGVGRFNNDEDGDGTNALWASVDAPGLDEWRQELMRCLSRIGVKPASSHSFTAHITLAYLPKDCPTPTIDLAKTEMKFDQVQLAWGTKHFPFKLEGSASAFKSKSHQGFTLTELANQLIFTPITPTTTTDSKGKSVQQPRKKTTPTTTINVKPVPALTPRTAGPKQSRGPRSLAEKSEFKALRGGGEVLYNGIAGIYIEGWASVRYPEDRYGDVLGPTSETFRQSVETYFNLNPILLYEHGLDPIIGNKPLGQVISYRFDDEYGLWVKAFVRKPTWQPMVEIYESIKAGILRTFSIGGLWSRQGQEIVSADLFELSVVATPAQPYAVFNRASKSYLAPGTKVPTNHAKTVSHKRADATALALAGVGYWTEIGQNLLSMKNATGSTNAERRGWERAFKYAHNRLARSLTYLDSVKG